jgi:hypothetical protein
MQRSTNAAPILFERYAHDPGGEPQCDGDHCRSRGRVLSAIGRSKTFLTDIACQLPPRAVEMPRALSASATARNVVAPAFWASLMIGRMFAACWSAPALIDATALSRASESLGLPRVTPRAFAAVGHFNPLILRPDWLRKKDLIVGSDSEELHIEVMHAELVLLGFPWGQLHCDTNQFIVATYQEPLASNRPISNGSLPRLTYGFENLGNPDFKCEP